MGDHIRTAQSHAREPAQIAEDLRQGLAVPNLALVLVYFSPRDDVFSLSQALVKAFGTVPVIGCSTFGEIGPKGYSTGSVVAAGLSATDFQATFCLLTGLSRFDPDDYHRTLRQGVEAARGKQRSGDNLFALTLFDGMSLKEEPVTAAIHAILGDIPICGGSAADGSEFKQTFILHDGQVHQDCALVTLISTCRQVDVFKTEHFRLTEQRVVITAADGAHRRVIEINGRPAADEYARLIGCTPDELNLSIFARYPVAVRIGGANFIRSILKADEDGSLSFACAIDAGLVVRIANGVDLSDNLRQQFQSVHSRIGQPELVLGFDCMLRRLELVDNGELMRAGKIMAANKVLGFSTYGEQFQGMHINQTFTGVAIGGPVSP